MVNNPAGKSEPARQREEGVDGTLTRKRKLSYSLSFIELFEIGNESKRTPLTPNTPLPPVPFGCISGQRELRFLQGTKSVPGGW